MFLFWGPFAHLADFPDCVTSVKFPCVPPPTRNLSKRNLIYLKVSMPYMSTHATMSLIFIFFWLFWRKKEKSQWILFVVLSSFLKLQEAMLWGEMTNLSNPNSYLDPPTHTHTQHKHANSLRKSSTGQSTDLEKHSFFQSCKKTLRRDYIMIFLLF